jgi:hypothetical protein
MDIIFKCTSCDQELAVDASGVGSEIECPTCKNTVVVPEATPQNIQSLNPISTSAAAKEDKHFSVPQRSAVEVLIKKPTPSLEVAAKDTDKKIRVRTIKHSDCVEVGKDRFDDVVSEALQKVGHENIISITPVSYSHPDITGRAVLQDYAVMIVFKG